MKRILVVLALSLGLTAKTQAMTGNDLSLMCKAELTSYCGGYIDGTVDGLLFANSVIEANDQMNDTTTSKPLFNICLPEGVNNSQLRKVVIKYLEDNPERLHARATVLIDLALEKAFPCD